MGWALEMVVPPWQTTGLINRNNKIYYFKQRHVFMNKPSTPS